LKKKGGKYGFGRILIWRTTTLLPQRVKSSHQLDLNFKTINTILKSEKIWLKVTLWKRKGKNYVFQIMKNHNHKIIKINLDLDFIAINTILKSDQNHIFPPFSSKFNYFLLYVYVNINNPTFKTSPRHLNICYK
jgi:hypothetical protein